jgi:hypothetical protein
VCPWEFSLSLATVHLEDVMLMSGVELDYIK